MTQFATGWQGVCGLLVAVAIAGCSGTKYPATAVVHGKVTSGGQPVPNAVVTFIPADGRRSATGNTNASGEFQLTTFKLNDGALIGAHGVAIYPAVAPAMAGEAISPDGKPIAASTQKPVAIADRYGAPATSGLTFEVSAKNRNDASFDLSPGK